MSEPIDLDAKLSLRGKFPGDRGQGPRRSDVGRVCADGACSTVLSIYNTGDHCWEHTPRSPYLLNVRRFRPARKQTA
ncbi:MAG TPA: hypothetical protein VEC09_00805 [Actinomycetota bacterium]|nr:hypothetical protein [Actinomycetota bacterium]